MSDPRYLHPIPPSQAYRPLPLAARRWPRVPKSSHSVHFDLLADHRRRAKVRRRELKRDHHGAPLLRNSRVVQPRATQIPIAFCQRVPRTP